MIRNLGQVAAIYIGSSAPRNTNLIWLDNTVVPFVFRAYDGSAWSEIATHKWVRAYVDGWLVTLPPRQLADDGDYMLINSNNVNYKITVKDFVKSAVGNPLDFKGVIRVSADFPNPSTLESGDMYVIITSPAGGTVTDPYSGKTFEDSEKIVWDEVTQSWESLGKIDITVDLTTSYSETEVTIHSSAGKETTIQGATDQLAGVMLPGQYSWLQALSNGSIVPGDPSPLTPLTPAHKHNYNDIINRLVSQQGTGESTIDPMSQKATTDALNLKFDKASVLQVSGAATDKVMSQKAVTDALKTLSDDFNNKLTNYLPLAGGTMKGNIVFNNNLFLSWKDTKGSTYQVLSMKSNDEINIGNASFPLNLYSKEDLFHKRNGEIAYRIWDAYNLPDPARLGVNQTFTGLNTFTKKTIIGDAVSPQILLDPANQIRYRYAAPEVGRGYTIALGDNNNIREFTFGGYYSASKNEEYAYLSLPGQAWDASTYKFYANSLKVPYKWSIDGPDGNAIIWSQTSEIVNLGRTVGTTKIRSGNTDLIHTKGSTEYIIWDKSNLPNPAKSTDLANYLPLIGGTLTGQVIFDSYGLAFNNIAWTNDLVPNRTYGGYLQVLDAYNASSDGGPTNYGTVLQINSRNAHWANQLWFSGGAEASKNGLYYRHMPYNETTYGEWNRLLTNKDVNIIQTQSSSNPSTLPVNQIFYSEIQRVDGTPTVQGALFSVQGDDEGIQLWASSSKTELYYRTKWTSFGNWIKLATTSDLGNYLPLTGGTLSGNLTINTVGSTTFVINNNDTNGSETFMRVLRKGTASAAIGFMDSLGAYIYNYNSNKYLFIDNDGYARVGTTNGSTRLALITDIPTVSGYLPLSGGTMSGNISFNRGTGRIVVGARETSNFVSAVSFNKGSATNSAYIGYHSTGGSDSSGALILVPYSTSANPWGKTVGLYIAKNELLLDGKAIATTDQIPSIPSISISNSGSGNAVTSITANGHILNVTKGATYLTSHQTIYNLTFQAGTFSAKTFDPNGAAATVNIPTKTSHITNDSGFITSSALNGYATQSWCNGQFAPLSRFYTSTGYTTIKVIGQEFNFDSANPEIFMNYRTLSGSTAVKKITWKGGSSTTLCEGRWGNLYMNDNLVATQTWSNSQYPLKTGTGASGTWDINISGNASTASAASKLGSTTIGGSAKPIYLSSGTPTACSATVGSATVPVYMNAGTITQCSTTLGVSITGNAATATNSTQLGGTAASSYVKANDNISRLTNDSGFITSSALNGYATQAWVNSQNFVKSTSTKKVTDIQPVDALPATQASGVLYLVFG